MGNGESPMMRHFWSYWSLAIWFQVKRNLVFPVRANRAHVRKGLEEPATSHDEFGLTPDSHLFARNSSHGRLHLHGHVEVCFWSTGYGHGVVELAKVLFRCLLQNELFCISHSQSPLFAPPAGSAGSLLPLASRSEYRAGGGRSIQVLFSRQRRKTSKSNRARVSF